MNLKFVRRVSERERAIRPFVIVKNKLMSVFNESVLLLTMNFVMFPWQLYFHKHVLFFRELWWFSDLL